MKPKYLIVPTYLVAALLILFPLLDTTLSVWPPRFGEVSWRFGMVGLFSRALMTPALGILLAFAVSLLLEQRRMMRVLIGLNVLAVVMLLVAMPMFTLDGLEMRAQVRPEAKLAFDVATVVAMGKMFLAVVVSVAFAWAGWKAIRRDPTVLRSESRSQRAELVVGR